MKTLPGTVPAILARSVVVALVALPYLSESCRAADIGERFGVAPLDPLDGIAVKPGICLRGLDERMYAAIRTARDIWLNHGGTLVITSGLDGRHRKGSRHYAGLALDFRIRNLGRKARLRVARELRKPLEPGFRVLVEKDHIHVAYHPPQSRGASKTERQISERDSTTIAEEAPRRSGFNTRSLP